MSPLLKVGSVILSHSDLGETHKQEVRRRREAESIAGWHPDRVDMKAFHLLILVGTLLELLARELELLEWEHGCDRVFQGGEFNTASTVVLNFKKTPLRERKNSFSSSNPKRSGFLRLPYTMTKASRWESIKHTLTSLLTLHVVPSPLAASALSCSGKSYLEWLLIKLVSARRA